MQISTIYFTNLNKILDYADIPFDIISNKLDLPTGKPQPAHIYPPSKICTKSIFIDQVKLIILLVGAYPLAVIFSLIRQP